VSYRVIVLPRAKRQLLDQAAWWAENRSLDQGLRWLAGFERALESLANNPQRCERARESDDFDFELRELRYGLKYRPTHRALFEVRGDEVLVYAVRHLHQRDIAPDEL
jgi:plasmid stabilization system protein ParE